MSSDGFKEYAKAARLRDVIRRIVMKLLDDERPIHRYGYVQSIDRVNRSCEIRYEAESSFFPVRMGAIQPGEVGQRVRIVGVDGDRWIDDVMDGPAVIDGTLL